MTSLLLFLSTLFLLFAHLAYRNNEIFHCLFWLFLTTRIPVPQSYEPFVSSLSMLLNGTAVIFITWMLYFRRENQ